MMSTLQIQLFGKFEICCNRQTLAGFEARKLQELFCYLLIHRQRSHLREALADVLWDGTKQSRNYLRKALWQLQNSLTLGSGPAGSELFLVEAEWIQLNPEADVWLDVAMIEQAFNLVEGVPGIDIDCETAQMLQEVIKIYRGDLLEACYADWCLYERERLRHLYLALLDKLMGYCEAQQQYESGIIHGMRILGCDRARERTHRRLMRLHYLAGDRTAALRQYQRCAQVLREELQVEPARSTQMLCQQIQGDRLPAVAPLEAGTTPPGVVPPSSPDRLTQLKNLQKALAEAQHQIRQEIQALESAGDR